VPGPARAGWADGHRGVSRVGPTRPALLTIVHSAVAALQHSPHTLILPLGCELRPVRAPPECSDAPILLQ
jgi:hypothetical protein